MARHESDREELLEDAVAFQRRAEWQQAGSLAPVFAGLRPNGWLSLYFDQDPVYQFDAHGRLRRAYVGGKLYRTQGATLAELERIRTADATRLQRRDLDERELDNFKVSMRQKLRDFRCAMLGGQTHLRGCVPENDPLEDELPGRIDEILEAEPWLAPPIAPRR